MQKVTIGFVPRERFSVAPASLESIFRNTRVPFHLIVVDCATPRRSWERIERVFRGRSNVEVIRTSDHVLPNASKNLVVERNRSEFLALVENDIIVSEGWLQRLIAACEEEPADVAIPLINEKGKIHFDRKLGSLRTVMTSEGEKYEFVPRLGDWEEDRGACRRRVQTLEAHAILFRSRVFDEIGLFDEALTTRREVDLSLVLNKYRIPIVYEPRATIEFMPPPPVRPEDRRYFRMVWDITQGQRSHDRIQQKWALVHLPGSIRFVRNRRLMSYPGYPGYVLARRAVRKMRRIVRPKA